MFNFTLAAINNVRPFGVAPNLSLHWFGLTDGEIHLDFDGVKIYEYSGASIKALKVSSTKYVSYYIARFVEDFISIFSAINEPIPSELYDLTIDISALIFSYEEWLAPIENDVDKYLRNSSLLFYWLDNRKIDSGHLVNGPKIYFFRHDDTIRIVWNTEGLLENGEKIWSASNGHCEMKYDKFVKNGKDFVGNFFNYMSLQVILAVDKN